MKVCQKKTYPLRRITLVSKMFSLFVRTQSGFGASNKQMNKQRSDFRATNEEVVLGAEPSARGSGGGGQALELEVADYERRLALSVSGGGRVSEILALQEERDLAEGWPLGLVPAPALDHQVVDILGRAGGLWQCFESRTDLK